MHAHANETEKSFKSSTVHRLKYNTLLFTQVYLRGYTTRAQIMVKNSLYVYSYNIFWCR